MPIIEEFFIGGSHLAQALSLLQLAFTIWMMVDAYHRGVETYWYWVIFFFQPLGAWVYFFGIKVRTLRWSGIRLTGSGQRYQSLEQLRYSVSRSPTVANRIALSERLMEKGAHDEAIPLLEAVLAVEPNYSLVLHALAECRLATGNPEQAVAPLEKLLQRDPCWADYRGWRTLLAVHRARERPEDALVTCREFVKRVPTLENKCRLAELLLDNGKAGEAVSLLDDALEEQQYAPWSDRWRNWRWSRMAQQLLLEAEKAAEQNENTEALRDRVDPDSTLNRARD